MLFQDRMSALAIFAQELADTGVGGYKQFHVQHGLDAENTLLSDVQAVQLLT